MFLNGASSASAGMELCSGVVGAMLANGDLGVFGAVLADGSFGVGGGCSSMPKALGGTTLPLLCCRSGQAKFDPRRDLSARGGVFGRPRSRTSTTYWRWRGSSVPTTVMPEMSCGVIVRGTPRTEIVAGNSSAAMSGTIVPFGRMTICCGRRASDKVVVEKDIFRLVARYLGL